MVTDFNSVHKQSESPPNVRRSGEGDHSRLPKVVGVMTSGIQAIVKREPKKWTKLYLYKSYFDHRLKHCDFNRTQDKEALGLRIRAVETLGYTSTCKNSGIDKR